MWSSPAGTNVSEDRGREDAAGAGVEISLQAMVAHVAPLQPMEDHNRADIQTAAMSMLRPRDVA